MESVYTISHGALRGAAWNMALSSELRDSESSDSEPERPAPLLPASKYSSSEDEKGDDEDEDHEAEEEDSEEGDMSDSDSSSSSSEESLKSTSGTSSSAPTRSRSTSKDVDRILAEQMQLLQLSPEVNEISEIKTVPLFTESVRRRAADLAPSNSSPFPQYGLLGGVTSGANGDEAPADPRVFYNIAAPSSVFICGSQGSGKSHSLSCLLENCLISSRANVLPRPLTGVVFHYDTFVSDNGGEPCEAAYLASNRNVKVRVLCAPTNIKTIRRVYSRIPNVTVEPLRLNESDLNTKRMMSLMAVDDTQGIPLYLHVIQRILRDLRLEQQQQPDRSDGRVTPFQYAKFKMLLEKENMTPAQLAPLKQRLDTLESFMVGKQVHAYNSANVGVAPKKVKARKNEQGTDWSPEPGKLTIVDLSCPCVQAQTACSLFNICLSLFLEQDTKIGRVVALDEAHKYMGGGTEGAESPDSRTLTENLLQTIRLQRHQACRIFISTQEPTVSPALLDLCSVTIVHRFTSPAWLKVLKQHLAGVSSSSLMLEKAFGDDNGEDDGEGITAIKLRDGNDSVSADPAVEVFSRIVKLRVGEALVFAPSAAIGVNVHGRKQRSGGSAFRKLGSGILKIRTRARVTADGGRSIMAD
ncbi:hypothetical protein MCOR02_000486 [Pyricularia oryzae]|nr:hypothetical protein MCOR02_000486 [Pyricularia oryzae]KAI6263240.1 hypothetical protein MCOR19_000565 [Pyricularia oryzae]KAI6383392.1 hypothetical protein MCOR32_002855 [Pyricularia oryzae]KAI6425328.1 hypothetical protein MCOR24_003115 [Pyricularia oryzae]KAI6451495.1 hypothetical protein MCOR22_001282 [Pyricularia oryzae]